MSVTATATATTNVCWRWLRALSLSLVLRMVVGQEAIQTADCPTRAIPVRSEFTESILNLTDVTVAFGTVAIAFGAHSVNQQFDATLHALAIEIDVPTYTYCDIFESSSSQLAPDVPTGKGVVRGW